MTDQIPGEAAGETASKRIPIAVSVSRLPWKEIAWVVAGQVATLAGSLAALKVLTTVLPASVYGEVNLVLVSCTLPTLVLLAPVTQSCFRFYTEHAERGSLPALLGTTIGLQIGVVVLMGLAVALALVSGGAERIGISPGTIAWGFVLFATDSGRNLCLTVAAAARKRTIVAAGFAADAWLRPIGAVSFVLLFGRESAAAIAGFAVAGICSLVPFSVWLARQTTGLRIERGIVSEILRYGLPYGIWGIFGWAQSGADRYMVDHWLTRADVGRYVAGSQVGGFPFSVAGAFVGQLINPVLFQRAGDGSEPRKVDSAKRLLFKMGLLFILFGLVTLLFLYLFGPALFSLLTGRRDYMVPLPILLLLSIGAFIFQLSQIFAVMFLIHKKSMLLLWPKIVGGITAVIIGILLIPKFGLLGAAISNVCASIILLFGFWMGPTKKVWKSTPIEDEV